MSHIVLTVIEAFVGLTYLLIGRIIHGKSFTGQEHVPSHIKTISGILAFTIFALIIWIIYIINN